MKKMIYACIFWFSIFYCAPFLVFAEEEKLTKLDNVLICTVSGYDKGVYTLSDSMINDLNKSCSVKINSVYNPNTNFIVVSGVADWSFSEKVTEDNEKTDINYFYAEKRANFVKDYLVNVKNIDISNIVVETASSRQAGPKYRCVNIYIRSNRYKLGSSAGGVNSPIDTMSKASPKITDEEVRKLVKSEMIANKDSLSPVDASVVDGMVKLSMSNITLPKPEVFKVGFGDVAFGVRGFYDSKSPYLDKGLLLECSISLNLFPWLAFRMLAGIGRADLGLATTFSPRLEIPLLKEDRLRIIFGGVYRGFDHDKVTLRTTGDQWFLPLGFSVDLVKGFYVEALTGYGWTSRVVDEDGNMLGNSEKKNVSYYYVESSISFGIRFDIKGSRKADKTQKTTVKN